MPQTASKTQSKTSRYIEAVGRRKTAVARVRITPASKNEFIINDRDASEHFPVDEMKVIAKEALQSIEISQKFHVSVLTKGGGIHAQAEAVRHGLARALVDYDEDLRKPLKKAGFLKRDPRRKERKKFGLKKARKSPQWSKR